MFFFQRRCYMGPHDISCGRCSIFWKRNIIGRYPIPMDRRNHRSTTIRFSAVGPHNNSTDGFLGCVHSNKSPIDNITYFQATGAPSGGRQLIIRELTRRKRSGSSSHNPRQSASIASVNSLVPKLRLGNPCLGSFRFRAGATANTCPAGWRPFDSPRRKRAQRCVPCPG